MNHLIFGIIAICAGLVGVFVWWDDFGLVLRGLIPIVLIVFGLVGIGASFLKGENNQQEERASP